MAIKEGGIMNNTILKENDPVVIIKYRLMDDMPKLKSGISFIEHYEKMYGFDFDEYIKTAYKILSDTQIEYRYLTNKVKLFYAKTSLTEGDLNNYFLKMRPITACDEKSVENITDLLLIDNEKIQIEYSEQGNYGDINVCCIPLRIPDHICILTDKIQKVYDLKYLMHELGRAIPLSSTFSNIKLLREYLFNEIMQEAYAYLYEDLVVYNSDFRKAFQLMLSQSDIDNCRFEELYKIRLLAAKVIYQKEFYSKDNKDYLRTFYQEIMQNSLLINCNSSTYSIDSVSDFSTIQKFIGKVIASKIQIHIENQFGLGWYKNKNASITLNHLFSHGGLVNPNNFERFLLS